MIIRGVAVYLAAVVLASAETITLHPVADLGLFENDPDNNTGATERIQVGLNGNGNRGRALYRFDLAGSGVPRGSVVNAVSVSLSVTAAGGGSVPTRHDLHRVQLSWNEGGSVNAPAVVGEGTWCSRSHGEAFWTVPGGNFGSDFAANASASVDLGSVGRYVVGSTPALVRDVQGWLDRTVANHGWALISANESSNSNTRRIGARESTEHTPILTIDYTPFEITSASRDRESGTVNLEWAGGTAPFEVEVSTDGENWTTVAGSGTELRNASVVSELVRALFRVRETDATTARYRVDWNATWSAATHPMNFPVGPHFSSLVGIAHNSDVSFWEPSGMASLGIERMAETGSTTFLISEFRDAEAQGAAGARLLGSGINSPGATSLEFDITEAHPLITLVTMIAPSPDWFAGVHGLSLRSEDGGWLDSLTVALDPYDAGTDSGTDYVSPDADNDEPISRITGAPFLDGDKVRPVGVFTFTRLPGE